MDELDNGMTLARVIDMYDTAYKLLVPPLVVHGLHMGKAGLT